MTTTEPSTDASILSEVARIIQEEPEKLEKVIHTDERIGTEKIADIFTWDIPALDVSIIVRAKTYARIGEWHRLEASLGAIQVIHEGTTHSNPHYLGFGYKMIGFTGTEIKVKGLAEAILALGESLSQAKR